MTLASAWVALALRLDVGAQQIVRVVDPQGAAVVTARMTIQCPGLPRWVGAADHQGRFTPLQQSPECALVVEAPGFLRWRGLLDDLRADGVVRLALTPVEERVEVTAPATKPSWSPLAWSRLTRDDLAAMGADSAFALRYAKARAGATLAGDRIYVDGMPAANVPPASMIDELSINADPFSVLYGDSDHNVIDIVSTTPDRKLWWSGGVVPKNAGARNPLAPDMTVERRVSDLSVGGPVPWTPMTFSLDVFRASLREERPIFSASNPTVERALSVGSAQTVAGGLVGQWRPGLRTRLSAFSSRAADEGVGAGGFVAQEASQSSTLASWELRFVVEASGTHYRYRAGLAHSSADISTRAASTDVGVRILDAGTRGGAAIRVMHGSRRNWLWNSTLTPTDASWLIGWSLAAEESAEQLEPNASGEMTFGSTEEFVRVSQGLRGGMLSRVAGSLHQTFSSRTGAVFGQKEWRVSRMSTVRAGARLDYQSGDGVVVSPRVSGRTTIGNVALQTAVGLFRPNWSPEVLMQTYRFATVPLIVSDVVLANDALDPLHVERIRTAVAEDFRRPVSFVVRNGVEARRWRLAMGMEHTWTSASSRPGSRRFASPEGWLDRLESSRRLRRHQLHARADYAIGGAALVAHYEWQASHDDGQGPFSFPEFQDDPRRDWARSAGVAPHTVSIVANLPPVGGINAVLIAAARSSAPVDVLTGLDPKRTRLYVDRGGRLRNSGEGPAYRSVDAFAYRRVAVPYVRVLGSRLFLDLQVSGENLLGSVNDDAIAIVIASPWYGRAVSAQPGRTIRVAIRVARRRTRRRGVARPS